jgi:uncharacterized membrane protein YcaP (DUF421 family)
MACQIVRYDPQGSTWTSYQFMDWTSLFLPDVPLLEIILRGSVMYIALFALLRVVLKRQTGSLRMTDLLLITLIADASQNAMAGAYTSLPDGLVLVGTILFWSYSFDWLGFKFAWFRKLTEPPPLPLIQEGKLLRRNLRQELITEDEVKSQLREQGLEDWNQVKHAFMESDGHISVIPYEQKQQGGKKRKER